MPVKYNNKDYNLTLEVDTGAIRIIDADITPFVQKHNLFGHQILSYIIFDAINVQRHQPLQK